MTVRIPDGGIPPRPLPPSTGAVRTSPVSAPSIVKPLQLSSDALHVQAAQQKLLQDETEGLNERRIAELQQAIDDGTYEVNSFRIAKRMMQFENSL